MDNRTLITGNSHPELAQKISIRLNIPIVDCTVGRFANGEINVKINQCIRNQHVFIIQTGVSDQSQSINDYLMETLILINACKLSSTKSITVILPHYPYARQDKKNKSRTPISARLVANLLETAGATRIVAVDLHASQIQGFFNIPCDNLYAINVLSQHLSNTIFANMSETEIQQKFIFISPDNGGVKRITSYSDKFNINNIIMHKQRDYSMVNTVSKTILIGDQELDGKIGIIVDDMSDTMGTCIKACQTLKDQGMLGAIVVVTHGILSDPAADRINNCDFILKVCVTNSLPQTQNMINIDKLEVVDITTLLSQVIQCISAGTSISYLFR